MKSRQALSGSSGARERRMFPDSMAGKPRILVIEDELGLQKLILRRASQEGVEVVQALSCAQGFALAVELRPQVILLDIHLPDGDGIELLRRLKRDQRTAHIPVVAWSGSDTESAESKTLAAGAVAYFEKSDLKALMRRLVGLVHEP